MESIEQHIEKDKKIVDDPTVSPAARRHYKEELKELVDEGINTEVIPWIEENKN